MPKPPIFDDHPSEFPLGNTYRAVTLKVIDGDTITVLVDVGFETFSVVTLRIADLDTPETMRAANEDEKRRGQEAKAFLKHLVLDDTPYVKIVPQYKKRGGGIAETLGRYVVDVLFWDSIVGRWKDVASTMKQAGHVKKENDKSWS